MKKKTKILLSVAIVSPALLLTLTLATTNKNNNYENSAIHDKQLAIYVGDDEGEYSLSNDSKFPTIGYKLNTEKSKCKNGGVLSQNENTKTLKLKVKDNDECTVYFDKVLFNIPEAIRAMENNKTPEGVTTEGPSSWQPVPSKIYRDTNFNGNTSSNNIILSSSRNLYSSSSSTNRSSRYYTYSDSYTYSNGKYTLTNPQVCMYSNCWETLKGKYVTDYYGSSSSTIETSTNLSTIYKVDEKSTSTTIYYTTIEDKYYTYADEYTYDESTNKFTLVNPQACRYQDCYETLKGQYVRLIGGSRSPSINTSSTNYIYKIEDTSTETKLQYTQIKELYFTYADSYTYDKIANSYKLVNPQVCRYSTCYETLKGKYVSNYQGSEETGLTPTPYLGRIYKVDDSSTANTLYFKTSTNEVEGYDYSKDGVYQMADDYGMSYYFRGAVKNNYLKFGKWNQDVYFGYKDETSTSYRKYFSLSECQNATEYNVNCKIGITKGTKMWWRVIRVNGDGTVRIMYDGTKGHINGEDDTDRVAITQVQWSNSISDAKYVGYMYGGANGVASTSVSGAQKNETDSIAKTVLEKWYAQNIAAGGYSGAVADRIFCNDRSLSSRNSSNAGFGSNSTNYGMDNRVWITQNTIFTCPQENDKFTSKNANHGNKATKYPVGLITADEVKAAGGVWNSGSNLEYYLYKGSGYWTLTPYYDTDVIYAGSRYYGMHLTNYYNLAPVINLTAEYSKNLIGSGTIKNPYRVE